MHVCGVGCTQRGAGASGVCDERVVWGAVLVEEVWCERTIVEEAWRTAIFQYPRFMMASMIERVKRCGLALANPASCGPDSAS